LNVRLPQAVTFAEITALVPFSTATLALTTRPMSEIAIFRQQSEVGTDIPVNCY
jgi:hypothetical protein